MPEAADRQGDPQGARAGADGDGVEEATGAVRASCRPRSSRCATTTWRPDPAFVTRIGQFRRRRRVRASSSSIARCARGSDDDAVLLGRCVLPGVLDLGYLFEMTRSRWSITRPARGSPQLDRRPARGYAVLAASAFRHVKRSGSASTGSRSARSSGARRFPRGGDRSAGSRSPRQHRAAALAVDDGPRPNPGSWCDRCSYRGICPRATRSGTSPSSGTKMMKTDAASLSCRSSAGSSGARARGADADGRSAGRREDARPAQPRADRAAGLARARAVLRRVRQGVHRRSDPRREGRAGLAARPDGARAPDVAVVRGPAVGATVTRVVAEIRTAVEVDLHLAVRAEAATALAAEQLEYS